MPTPYLNLTQVSAGQNNKEVTINADLLALEQATQGQLVVDMSAGDVLLSVPQYTRNALFVASGLAADQVLTVPNDVGAGANTAHRLFAVFNNSSFNVSVAITGGAGSINISPSFGVFIASDGNELTLILSSFTASGTIGMFLPGAQEPSEVVMEYIAAGNGFTLPAGLSSSRGRCISPPLDDVEFIIAKNSVPIGSVLFAGSASTATFSLASANTFSAGDYLSIISPADTFEIEDVSITFATE